MRVGRRAGVVQLQLARVVFGLVELLGVYGASSARLDGRFGLGGARGRWGPVSRAHTHLLALRSPARCDRQRGAHATT